MLETPVRETPPATGHFQQAATALRSKLPVPFVVGAVAAGCLALFASRLSGTPAIPVLPGLPDAGAFTRLAVPLAKTAYDIAAVGVCGTLLLGVLLLPHGHTESAAPTRSCMRSASRWALSWAVSAFVLLLLTLSEVLARPLPRVLSWEILGQFAYSFDATRALMSSAALAVLTAVAARCEPARVTRVLVALLAVGALLPPLVTGHAGHARYHVLAVTSLSVHVVSASVWIGGLMALILLLRGRVNVLASVLPRFSRVALLCCAGVGLSGVFSMWIRLAALDQLWTTGYGRLALAKTGALVVLAAFGWWHRQRTIPAVRDGRPRAFLLVAATEVAIMLATIGLAVALARTPPPERPGHQVSAVVLTARPGV